MSKENVEVVRRAWEASQRRDTEAALALYDAEVEIDLTAVTHLGWSDVYFGVDGVQAYFRELLSNIGELKTDVDEWIDAGSRVIAMIHTRGRGKHSGVPVDKREAHMW